MGLLASTPQCTQEPTEAPRGTRESTESKESKVPLDCKTFLRERTGNVFDFYEHHGELGEGAYSDVWLARQRIRAATSEEHAGRTVAIKRVRKPNSSSGLDEDA